MGAERGHVAVRTLAAGEGGPGDRQPVVLDGIEHAQTGVGAVARQQNHFHPAAPLLHLIDGQQLLDQRKGIAGAQDVVLVGNLIILERIQTLVLEHLMAVAQVEQGPGADRHHQFAIERNRHNASVVDSGAQYRRSPARRQRPPRLHEFIIKPAFPGAGAVVQPNNVTYSFKRIGNQALSDPPTANRTGKGSHPWPRTR